MYEPAVAAEAGFLDQVVEQADFEDAVSLEAARLAALPAEAHRATKERARGADLETIRKAIDTELSANT